MGDNTTIEWTDATWNPVVGCEWVSPGCDHCYAAREAAGRLSRNPTYAGLAVRGDDGLTKFTGEVRTLEDRLTQPLAWKRPRRIFVNSMSDLFHPDLLKVVTKDRFGVERPFLAEVVAVMIRAKQHTFQVLTKRPPIMRAVLDHPMFRLDVNAILLRDAHRVMPGGMSDPDFRWPAHLQFGTSIESDRYCFRADHVRASAAAVKFLSLEPLLGPLPHLDLTGIDWVIVGGESGPGARPMHPDWARDLRDRCVTAGVPFLFKQWGEWAPTDLRPGRIVRTSGAGPEDGVARTVQLPGWKELAVVEPEWACGLDHPGNVVMQRVGKHAAGRELDGRTWDEYPT